MTDHDDFVAMWSPAGSNEDYDPELDRFEGRSEPNPHDADEIREGNR